MASNEIKLKALDGTTYLYPQTKAGYILDDNAETKIGQEHIVNKVESVKYESTELVKSDSTTVNLPVLNVVKEATAETGYAATYKVTQTIDGTTTQIGASINIIKDFLVKSASIKLGSACDPQQTPLDHKFIDFVVNVKDDKSGTETDSHIFLDVQDLVDAYTAGNGLTLSADNKFSVNLTADKGLALTGTEGSKTLEVVVNNAKAVTVDSDGIATVVDDSTIGYNATSNALEVKDLGVTTAKITPASASGKVLKTIDDSGTLKASWESTEEVALDEKTIVKVSDKLQVATADTTTDTGIKTANIQDSAVTTAKIADGNVTEAKLDTDSVTTVKIVDANVTTAKIADDNVTFEKLKSDDVIKSTDVTASAPFSTLVTDDTLATSKAIYDNMVADVQINGGSILQNNVANILIASTSSEGVVKIDDSTIKMISGTSTVADNQIYVPTATSSALGVVKVDGTITTLNSDNQLSIATFMGGSLGNKGLVPTSDGDTQKYFCADGNWKIAGDITYEVIS